MARSVVTLTGRGALPRCGRWYYHRRAARPRPPNHLLGTVAPRSTALHPDSWVEAYPDDTVELLGTAIYARERLVPGDCIDGPAILTQLDATTVIPSTWKAVVAHSLDIVMTRRD